MEIIKIDWENRHYSCINIYSYHKIIGKNEIDKIVAKKYQHKYNINRDTKSKKEHFYHK